ncbi:MAG TPA: hypothetical protein VLQ76_01620, partial [Bacteroidales bacterium]|nr:hypothetical protein [Bacteroidales bacterium]
AGFMWMGVGIMLCEMAFRWLVASQQPLPFAVAGIATGIAVYRFGFVKIAQKNINRIEELPGKRCFFSFMTFRSYLLVIVMMTLGITLRHSAIPREWLSVLYNGIGIGLALSSFRYFKSYLNLQSDKT